MNKGFLDGGMVRKVYVGEADRFRDHLLRLDPDSRRNRFAGAVSEDFIARYVSTAFRLDTVLHGYFVDGLMRGAAELRSIGAGLGDQAELAFSVEKPWQSLGIGSALLERTLLVARNRGYKLLHMACAADNRRMQQLAAKFDAQLTFDFGSVIGEVETPYPTPLSVFREIMIDSHGFATAMLDVQTRMLKPS